MSTLKIWQHSRTLRLGLPLALGLTLTIVCLLSIGALRSPDPVLAQDPTIRYVAPAPTGNDSNDCTISDPCATVQHAVDEADPGDEIRIASGVYTGVQARSGVTQVIYIDEAVTVQGGYTTAFTDPPDPQANPTTLDAQGQGRVFYITGDISSTIEGLNITGGNAVEGGGVYVITATPTIRNNTISGNHVITYGRGGGLFFINSPGATLSNNTISDNHNHDYRFVRGGGLCFVNSPDAMLHNNTVSWNTVSSRAGGGGLYFYASPRATLASNTIISNRAYGWGDVASGGGGLYCQESDNMTLTDNVIDGNVSAGGAGLLFNVCNDMQLAKNVIVNNIGTGGGGLGVASSNGVELSNNRISGNRANRAGGGAMFANSDHVTLVGNTVTANDTHPPNEETNGEILRDYGAGLYFENSTNVNLVSNIVTSNTLADFGGGLYLINSTATMTNNVVADNEIVSRGTGSGLYIAGSSPDLLHTTIARNSGGDGSGVYITGTLGTAAMTNTILASQTVGVYAEAGNSASLNGVLWYDNGTKYDGPGTIVVSNEHTGNPAFGDDGYHLTDISAAIDKGVNAGVFDDIDGHHRPCGLGPDLGADEFGYCIHLPLIFKNP